MYRPCKSVEKKQVLQVCDPSPLVAAVSLDGRAVNVKYTDTGYDVVKQNVCVTGINSLA